MITNHQKKHLAKLVKREEMKRRKKAAKLAEKIQSKVATPKKAKNAPVQMQKDARKVIEDLRFVNHRLTGQIATLKSQLVGIAA